VFSGSIHERKKEFALLRILGATRKKLVAIVLGESSLAGLAGGAAGVILASLAVFPFSTLINERLELPYLEAPFFKITPWLGGLFFFRFWRDPWLRFMRRFELAGRKLILPCGRENDGTP
jgi:putative ABC transport system permease protein